MNADYVIKNFEPGTSKFQERIEAAGKVAHAGYPLGFIITPIIWHEGWKEGYTTLLERLYKELPVEATKDLTFEMIQHRFTRTAKNIIEKRYPKTKLEMDEEKRKYKWGKYGKGKYVYKDEQANALREFITEQIFDKFPVAEIEYFT